jgi:hypothetical protein
MKAQKKLRPATSAAAGRSSIELFPIPTDV